MPAKKTHAAPAHTQIHHSELMHSSAPTYSVYIHHKKDQDDIENLICWEKRESTKNREKAIESARSLHKSYNCDKIEVKKTYHSPKHGKMIDKTIKIYDENKKTTTITSKKTAITLLTITIIAATALWIWG